MFKMNKKKRKLKRMRKKQKDNYDVDMLNNRILLMGTSTSYYMEEMLGPTKNAAKVVESLNKVLKHKLVLTNGAKKELRHE